eukprot:gene8875-biopygen22669
MARAGHGLGLRPQRLHGSSARRARRRAAAHTPPRRSYRVCGRRTAAQPQGPPFGTQAFGKWRGAASHGPPPRPPWRQDLPSYYPI